MMMEHKTVYIYVIYTLKSSMKFFVAGASSALGGPLMAELLDQHQYRQWVPSPVDLWLPAFAREVGKASRLTFRIAFARYLGVPPPPRIMPSRRRDAVGEDAVYYGTKLAGSSNQQMRLA
jgi:hypothetical protein